MGILGRTESDKETDVFQLQKRIRDLELRVDFLEKKLLLKGRAPRKVSQNTKKDMKD